jgi:F-type H+-transporting ATPase subunit alpha
LEGDLFYAGIRPAVNVGLSVSRVGGKAQTKAMRQVAAQLRLDLAQYRELAAFTQFGSEIDKNAQAQLVRGQKMTEILKQGIYETLSLAKQVMIIFAGNKAHLDDLSTDKISEFIHDFYKYMDKNHPEIEKEIQEKKILSDDLMSRLDKITAEFKSDFVSRIKK